MRKFLLFLPVVWCVLVPASAWAGSMSLLGVGKAGALPGPPTLTYNTTGAASGTTAQTLAVTLPSSGGPFWVGVLTTIRPSPVISSITLTNSSGTSSCIIDSQNGDNSTIPTVGVAHCLTSAADPGASILTINYASNPFNGTIISLWTAPSSGFASLTPAGTTTAGLASASSISGNANATTGGFCLALSNTAVILTGPSASSSGSTFTYTQRALASANGQSYWSADAPASSTTTETTAIAWTGTGLPTRIGLSVGCWR